MDENSHSESLEITSTQEEEIEEQYNQGEDDTSEQLPGDNEIPSLTRGLAPYPDETLSFATAQLQWTKHVIENYTYHPHNVLLLDIDQDGDLDVAATIRDDARVVWHEAPEDPTGSWTEHMIDDNSNVSKPDYLWSEDIDEDGDIDLLITDAAGNTTYWYECPADPKADSWNRWTIDNNISNPHCIITGDIDQDGDPDAVGTELDGSDLRWYQAPDDPTNSWTQIVIDSALSGTHDVRIEDMDDDGDLDIVLSEFGANKLHWYECPTDPVSGTWNKYTISTVGSFRGIYVDDIDEDGNPDVLGCYNMGGTIFWYEAPDDPTTGTWTTHTIDSSISRAVYVWVDDMDEDGNPDIIATGEDGDVKWYEAPDDATTGTWTEHVIDDDLDRAYYVVTGDIDQDGDPDVCVAGHDENQIVWYESNSHDYNGSDVGFWPEVVNESYDGWCVAVHDIDDDGDPDMIHTDYLNDIVVWSEAPDDPTDEWTTHTIGTGIDYAWDVFVADIDEDGNPDVVTSASEGDEVVWFEAPDDPTNSWTQHDVTTSLDDARGIWVADIDEDGNLDVVAAGYRDCEFQWYEAPDDPTNPWTAYTIDWVANAHDVCVGDIDEDGNPDVVGVSFDNTIEWYEAPDDPTTGSWTTHSIDSTLYSPSDVCIGDIDEDGNPDVIVSGYNTAGENVVWYKAPDDPTTGSWTQQVVEDDLDFATSIDIGDINEDGKLDIVAVGDYEYLRWYECPQDLTDPWFMREVEHHWTNARDVKLADIDEDGDLDTVASSSTQYVRWYNNEFLVINEVMFDPNGSDAGNEWVEIYNPTGPVNLSGWTLESADGTVLTTFSDYYIPFDSYLTVHLGTGTDDWDFSDGIGEHYTGGTIEYLDNSENGTGLFAPISARTFVADNTTIIDFLQWDDDSSYSGDTTVYDIAISNAPIWEAGDYVDLASYIVSEGESIGRDNMSLDTNSSLDWEDHGGKDAVGATPGERNIDGNYTAPETGELDPEELDDAPDDILGDYFLYVTNEGRGGGGETVIQIDNDGLAGIVGTGFDGPSGIAVNETSSDLYVSDDNSAAYIVETDGTLTTILDSGELDNPNALAFDDEGRLLIADAGQGCIYRANLTTGVVETVAEYFSVPQSVAIYDEDIYFTDYAGWVYRVSEEDIPEESPEDARFSDFAVVPSTEGGIVINSTGTIYVSDYQEGKVFKVEQDGSCQEIVDFSDFQARGLTLHPDDESLLFLTGYDTDQIILIDLTDNTPYLFADDASTGDLLLGPFGMVLTENEYDEFDLGGEGEDDEDDEIDPDDLDDAPDDVLGDYFLYVANEGNGGGGENVTQIANDGTATIVGTGFNGPSGLAINETSTDLYVSDDNDGIYAVETDGTLTTVLNSGLANPNGLAFDDEERLLIADAGDSIWRADLTTGTLEHLADDFNIPQAVAFYGDDIYFTDSEGYVYRIQADDTLPVTPSTVEEFSDSAVVPFTEGGMVINSTGYIYVSDYDHGRVVRVAPDGSDTIIVDFSNFLARGLALHPDNESLLFVTGYDTEQIILVDLTDQTATLFADETTTGDLLFGPFGMVITEYNYTAFSLGGKGGEEKGKTLHVGQQPDGYSSIKEALKAAEDGDTIWIHQGDYSEGTLQIRKNVTITTDSQGINLTGSILIFNNGFLELQNAIIRFNATRDYQHRVRVYSGELEIVNSTLTRAGDYLWNTVEVYSSGTLLVENSTIEHCYSLDIKNSAEIILSNSTFRNLERGIYGYLAGDATPILNNITSINNYWGILSLDDSDWELTGNSTNLTNNRYFDVGILSSGNIKIPSWAYENSKVWPGATGRISNNPPNAPKDLFCEGMTTPSNVLDTTPEFSWTFSDNDGKDIQEYFQILVGSSLGDDDMWNSGKVCGQAGSVSYAGSTLAWNTSYYWMLKTWDNHGNEGLYCSSQRFTMATHRLTIYVDDNWEEADYECGEEIEDNKFWELNAFASILDAVKAAKDGDTIWVHQGDYSEGTLLIRKDLNVTTDSQGINLTGSIWIIDNGVLKLKDALIRFNATRDHQYRVRVYSGELEIVNSTLTRAGNHTWLGVEVYSNGALFMENSTIEHCYSLNMKNSAEIILINSTFKNFGLGLYGYLAGDAAPILHNITSINNYWGLGSFDDTDWVLTGSSTNLSNNRYCDLGILSSGNITIPSGAYETSCVWPGATGNIMEP